MRGAQGYAVDPRGSEIRRLSAETDEVDFSHPLIQAKSAELFNRNLTDVETAQIAYEFVRDEIAHAVDIQATYVTCKASDVLAHKQGICYAKSNLLAALLRSQGIPAGFCYQRLMLSDTPAGGYCIHSLNAVYLESLRKWVRLDARGNVNGIDAQFSTEKETLAFTPKVEWGEKDYPVIFAHPHPKTIATLKQHTDALEMCRYHLPEDLDS